MINLETRNRNWDFDSEEDIENYIFQTFMKSCREVGSTTVTLRVRDICAKMGVITSKMFSTVFHILNSKDYHHKCAIQLDQKYKVSSIEWKELRRRVDRSCRKWDFTFIFKINYKLEEVFYVALKEILRIIGPLMVPNLGLGTFHYLIEINSIFIIEYILFIIGPLIILLTLSVYFYIRKIGGKYSYYFCFFAAYFSFLIFPIIFLYPETLFQIIIFIVTLCIFFIFPTPKKAPIPSLFMSCKLVFLNEKRENQELITGYVGLLGIYSVSILSGLFGTLSIYPLLGYFTILLVFILPFYFKHLIELSETKRPENYNFWLSRLKNLNTVLMIVGLSIYFSQVIYLVACLS